MTENIIGTSSYSEAMDLSDLDDYGYDQQSIGSVDSAHTSTTQASVPTGAQVNTNNEPQEPPVKIRKKPGRKPNPASPALRKAQNRAAQRAFRERKERHMKDLETNIKSIKDERDKLLQENANMSSENEILKSENWYLKGIVLSLQLVCLQHKLVIPRHCPHLNDQSLSVLAQSIPKTISSYLNVNAKSKHQLSQKLMDPTLQSHSSQPPPSSYTQSLHSQQGLPSGSILITQDGVQTVQNKCGNSHSQPNGNDNSWYHQQSNTTSQPPAQSQSHYEGYYGSPNTSTGSVQDEFSNIPPLSPMSTSDREKMTRSSPQPVLLANEPVTSNLAAIQTLRLRLRLQSACVRMQSMPFAIQPTLLQLSIPHDPRIDLIPTPHMRDRMILYRDQFDLDDCFRCLLSGSVFHGGDPAVAGNWQLPAEFFEKYWFLTIDYDIRRYTNEWRKKQGLEEINPNIPSINHGGETPMTTTPPQSQQKQQPVYVNNPPPPSAIPQQVVNLSYEDLSGYLGVQLNKHQPQQESQPPPPPPPQQKDHITPIQLTNGFGIMGSSPVAAVNSRNLMSGQAQAQQQPSPWQNLLVGSKNYDMMMSGLYGPTSANNSNNIDMDETSN